MSQMEVRVPRRMFRGVSGPFPLMALVGANLNLDRAVPNLSCRLPINSVICRDLERERGTHLQMERACRWTLQDAAKVYSRLLYVLACSILV